MSLFNIFVSVDRYYNLAVNNGTDELRNITLEKVRIVKYCLFDFLGLPGVLTTGYVLVFGLGVTWLKPVQYGMNRFTPL